MISNESKRQIAYDRLRKLTSGRVTRILGISEDDLETLSLGALINMLFLMHGDGGSTGNFNVSFSAAIDLVGTDLIWQEPVKKPVVAQMVQ